ncbi:YraN family protein [Clostridium carnis]
MKNYNKDIGNYGEEIAYNYLKNKGYYTLAKNYRNKFGEIDLICKKDGIIIFIEIKSRYSNLYGTPKESVTYSKQKQIINLCKFFINYKKLFQYNCRFDVVEIFFNNINNTYIINHLEDAFRDY